MYVKKSGAIIGVSVIVAVFALNASAQTRTRSDNVTRAGAVSRAPVHSSPASGTVRSGFAKTAARGNTSAWTGYRARGNYNHSGYYRGHYHGYYGWGSYWPYWSVGTFMTYLPDDYTTVYVDGIPYYYCYGSYFAPYSNGYMVVPAPSAPSLDQEAPAPASSDEQSLAAPPKSASSDTATINIPNSKGAFTPVRLTKHKNGYLGPQGEFYTGHPTVAALKALYGD
jgi:hypothetical protein